MLLRHVVSLAVAVMVAVADYGAAQDDGYVQIDLTAVTGPNIRALTIELPAVCGLNFIGVVNSSLTEKCNQNRCNLTLEEIPDQIEFIINTTEQADGNLLRQLTVNFTFLDDSSRFACRQYLFNETLKDDLSFECDPVLVCDKNVTEGVIVWSKFFNESDLRNFIDANLQPSEYTYPTCSYSLTAGQFDLSGCDVSSATTNAVVRVTDNTLGISNAEKESLGYYLPSLVLSNGTTLHGQVFVVHYNPEFTNDDDRNYTVVEGKNTDAVECVARSFPPSIVTWRLSKTLDGLDNPDSRISEDPGHRYFNDIGSFMPGFELSIDGQIVIMNASSVDERFYRCTVTNEASGEIIIRNRILRVRDTLRPLWPALGFILTLISVAVIIGVNSLVEKLRGEKAIPVDDDDFDGDANERTYSTSDHDSPTGTEQKSTDHAALRRLSSAKQELLPDS